VCPLATAFSAARDGARGETVFPIGRTAHGTKGIFALLATSAADFMWPATRPPTSAHILLQSLPTRTAERTSAMSERWVFGPWLPSEPQSFKPIVRVGVVSYRVTRLAFGKYEVVRIHDDRRVGTFRSFPEFEVTSAVTHPAFVRQIARAAMRGKRANWAERLAFAWRRRVHSNERAPASS
jgi:hypothetical protein